MARIVGTGAVRVFPVMTGFKKSVSQEMSGSGSQGAKKFTDSLKGMGSKAGKQLGKEFGTTAKDAMKNVGGDEMKQLSKDVASAAAAVSQPNLTAAAMNKKTRNHTVRHGSSPFLFLSLSFGFPPGGGAAARDGCDRSEIPLLRRISARLH